jgi:hypothetical protein
MPIIEATNKHNKIIMEAMDWINIVQLDIDNNDTKF